MQDERRSDIEGPRPLECRTALVTGGSSGIGAEICRELVRQGVSTIITLSRPQNYARAGEVGTELSSMGAQVFWIGADLSEEDAPDKIVEEIKKAGIDQIDILVNNAGMPEASTRASEQEKQKIFRTNYLAPFELTKALIPFFSKDANVVNISSVAGVWKDTDQPTYSEAKRLLIEMARSWAMKEPFTDGARINVVAPGFIDGTGMTKDIPQVAKDIVVQETPEGQVATTQSVAKLVVQIVNPASSANGELFIEDGGLGDRTPDILRRVYREGARALIAERRAARQTQSPSVTEEQA